MEVPDLSSGLCAQSDPDAFYPNKGGTVGEQKRICHRCPVEAQCLEWSLVADERFGIWGGKTARERAKLRRVRRAAAIAQVAALAAQDDGEIQSA